MTEYVDQLVNRIIALQHELGATAPGDSLIDIGNDVIALAQELDQAPPVVTRDSLHASLMNAGKIASAMRASLSPARPARTSVSSVRHDGLVDAIREHACVLKRYVAFAVDAGLPIDGSLITSVYAVIDRVEHGEVTEAVFTDLAVLRTQIETSPLMSQ